MKDFIAYEGQLANGMPYTLVGLGKNGSTEQIDDGIFKVGEDTALIFPEQNIVGVFDGAGGHNSGFDDPSRASRTAAFAVREYFTDTPNPSLPEAMEYARSAVQYNVLPGISTGLLVKIGNTTIQTVVAGDSLSMTNDPYESTNQTVLNPQQGYGNAIDNYLGKTLYGVDPDVTETHAITPSQTELCVMTDGVAGHLGKWDELQFNHFQDAHDQTLQFFLRAYTTDANFAAMTKEYLRNFWSMHDNRQAFENKMAEYEMEMGAPAELVNPLQFDPYTMHPFTWLSVLEPKMQSCVKQSTALTQRAIATALLRRPIAWPQEREHLDDDATLIMIDLSQKL